MHGLGNDYVYADCINEMIENPSELAIKLSDRHFGVGSDGLIMICPSKKAEFEMRLYNADGSYGLMCGNGIRCVGKYLYDNGYVTKDCVDVESGGQVKHLKLKIEDGVCVGSRVDMGVPLIPGVKGWTEAHADLEVDGEIHNLTLVDMGNPHGVKFIDDVDKLEIEKIGPKLENHKFLKKTSKLRAWFKFCRTRYSDRKVYKYVKCPNCKNYSRVPKGKGKIKITCRVCKKQFDRSV